MMSLFSLLCTKFAISFILDSLRPSMHSFRAVEKCAFVRSIKTSEDRNTTETIYFSDSLCSISSSSLQYYHRLLHNLHLKRMYHLVSASVGDTITQKRHCSLPAVDESTIYKGVRKKHHVL
uniref:Secreted protein n=1 Tax=Rousettus aegyptiacus TaxID=9407 RepID=A0A7J8KB29_ROUAE|nr:hypothetical protein HJG63_007885 [Rousettus aegyptiacus]